MGLKPHQKLHLICSVYLSPTPLGHQRYDTSHLKLDADDYSRIGRFLSGLTTLKGVQWSSAVFYVTLDPQWGTLFEGLRAFLENNFPGAQVVSGRLVSRLDWLNAASGFDGESLIYLHANDDHALVCAPQDFENEAARLAEDPTAELMMVTHFPEVTGMLYRKRPFRPLARNSAFPVGYALGTTLVKTRFYRSWWSVGKFHDDEIIYRPDNPVGKSVTFESSTALAPRFELIRHMDGYAHVLCQEPLAPLRNLVTWADWGASVDMQLDKSNTYSRAYWPTNIFGVSGSGADLHETKYANNFGDRVRVTVARLNAQWGLRMNVFDLKRARLYPTPVSATAFLCGFIVTLLLPRNLRNAIDALLDPIAIPCLYAIGLLFPGYKLTAKKVYYLGTLRTLISRA